MLKTPRDVVQVVNALRLLYPPISLNVHYGDLVWLQILKVARRNIYEWIERYLTEYSTVAHGDGRVRATNGKSLSIELDQLLPEDGHGNGSLWSVWDRLPGIRAGSLQKDESRVFDAVTYSKMQAHQTEKRLASPVHYRYYFSFTAARNAFSDARLDEVLSVAKETPAELPITLGALLVEERKYGSTWFEHFLRRLIYRGLDGLTDDEVVELVYATSSLADDALRASDEDGASGYDPTWRLCSDLLKAGLEQLNGDQASLLLNRVIDTSPSLGWVVGEVVGSELFRHDRIQSDRTYFDSDKVFTEDQLDHALSIIRSRLAKPDQLELMKKVPRLPQVLFRWEAVAGSVEPIQRWLTQFDTDEDGYVDLLLRMRGWAMSDRVYRPLNRRTVDHFMPFESMLARLRDIVEKQGPNAQKASELLRSTELDRDFS